MEQSSSAAERPILFWPMGLQPETLTLVGMTGVEGVSELYRFDIELCAPVRTDIPFERVVGQRALMAVRGPGATREIEGVVREFTVTGQDEEFAYYQAQLVPEFWLWTRRIRSRIFQRQTTIEILREVLTGLEVVFELHADYPQRNYCVQYQESDFAFASRLMEEEGIRYFFRRRQLVLMDRALQHPENTHTQIRRPFFNSRRMRGGPAGRTTLRPDTGDRDRPVHGSRLSRRTAKPDAGSLPEGTRARGGGAAPACPRKLSHRGSVRLPGRSCAAVHRDRAERTGAGGAGGCVRERGAAGAHSHGGGNRTVPHRARRGQRRWVDARTSLTDGPPPRRRPALSGSSRPPRGAGRGFAQRRDTGAGVFEPIRRPAGGPGVSPAAKNPAADHRRPADRRRRRPAG